MAKSQKPPVTREFNSPVEIRITYQLYYLKFINDLAPDVASELKQLTSSCIRLFGEFPQAPPDSDPEENRKIIADRVDHVYWDCVRKESRSTAPSSWTDYMPDKTLRKSIVKIEQSYKIAEAFANRYTQENLEELKEKAAELIGVPACEILPASIERVVFKQRLKELIDEDSSFAKAIEIEASMLKGVENFQSDFDSLLKRHILQKEWIARRAFFAIWNGTGIFELHAGYSDLFPKNIIADLGGDPEPRFHERKIPLHEPFVFEEHFARSESFDEYERKAIEEYTSYIRDYTKKIEQSMSDHALKRKTRPHEFKNVGRLVWWNIKKMSKHEILVRIDQEREKLGREVFTDVSTLNKSLRRLSNKYDLPFREE